MKKQLVSIAMASALLAAYTQNVLANDDAGASEPNKPYIGAGIGAITGAFFAGPLGFVAGGLIGGLAAKHDSSAGLEEDQLAADNALLDPAIVYAETALPSVDENHQTLVAARTEQVGSVINEDAIDHASPLKDFLVSDMQLNIFFLSGSTSVEAFYSPRLVSIARIMQQIPEIDVHLGGYSDRRGDKDKNLALATARLDAVRNELVEAGIAPNRIHLNAYGEQQFLSSPGDLEAYTFDRRVVIRFEPASPQSENPVALVENIAAP